MNIMNDAWGLLKGDEEFRINTNINDRDRQRFGVKGLNPDDVPTSVPRAIQQSRPVNINRRGDRYGMPVARLQGEGADAGEEGMEPGNFYQDDDRRNDQQGKQQSRGRHMQDETRPFRGYNERTGNRVAGRRRNTPTVIDPDDDEEVGDMGADVEDNYSSHFGARINDVGQQVQAVPRPTVGRVDDLSRQAAGGVGAQTSGFQSKDYGRFMNRQPKMGPAGMPQGMGAFDQVNPQFKQTLRGMGVKTGMPMAIRDAWYFMKDERVCDDCGKSGSCKKCCDDCGKKKCAECMDKGSCA